MKLRDWNQAMRDYFTAILLKFFLWKHNNTLDRTSKNVEISLSITKTLIFWFRSLHLKNMVKNIQNIKFKTNHGLKSVGDRIVGILFVGDHVVDITCIGNGIIDIISVGDHIVGK